MKGDNKMKLKKWVKNILVTIGVSSIIIAMVMIVSNRIEEIENGSIKVVSESEMAERN